MKVIFVCYLLTLAVNLVVHRQYNNKIIMYSYHATHQCPERSHDKY